jgi:FkbM family methyltransferase
LSSDFVPTLETVDEIARRAGKVVHLSNFIAYDFTFLSFGRFNHDFHKSLEFQELLELMQDGLSSDILKDYVYSRNTCDYVSCEKHFSNDQYFPKDIINLGSDEIFVDCGVYDFATSNQFIRETKGDFRLIFGFEPDNDNFKTSSKNVPTYYKDKVSLYNIGSWSGSRTLRFNKEASLISGVDPNGVIKISVDSIDNVVLDNPVSYIKMDVEGAELESLKGAVNTILKNRPKLAICLYHNVEDLCLITNYVNSLNLEYKFFVRLHTRFSQELVLYCV